MANNIFLIGFSGSGKSSVGKKLAKHLNYNFLDTDRIIEKTTSLSIDETINTKGEKDFDFDFGSGLEHIALEDLVEWESMFYKLGLSLIHI